MKTITLLVAPPGAGKTTWVLDYIKTHNNRSDLIRISQDDQGKIGHMDEFLTALSMDFDIVVDRMNFDKAQRERYLKPARDAGYSTRIIVMHAPKQVCLDRCNARKGHPTIKDEKNANEAVNFFFSKYERVEDTEADQVMRMGWVDHRAAKCVWSDLDGTLANVEHRRHHVRPVIAASVILDAPTAREEAIEAPIEKFKPDWKKFFEEMTSDTVDEACKSILDDMSCMYPIVYATGRPDNYREHTEVWLQENRLRYPGSLLFMRMRNDMRKDNIVKEIILEFEVKTRYTVFFALDDRDQVVEMLRRHGVKVLQVAEGDF